MTVPTCLVIVPDGNRRWAREHHRRDTIGHTNGLINCRRVSRAAFDCGVQHVVLWAASELNLCRRPPHEIVHIFRLLKRELRHRIQHPEDIGFHLRGAWQRFTQDQELMELVREAHEKTAQHTKRQLTILFGYSGRTELVEATAKLLASGQAATAETIRAHLWTSHVPDVDLLIRTGTHGDPHWSDSLLPWQMHNAQLCFSPKCWPEFGVEDLQASLEDYNLRVRRAGS